MDRDVAVKRLHRDLERLRARAPRDPRFARRERPRGPRVGDRGGEGEDGAAGDRGRRRRRGGGEREGGAASSLSDVEVGRPEGSQQTTARTILSNHEGSRTWLVVRALRELGIAADVAIAENEPFSSDPAFPPHEGRFTHRWRSLI